VVGTPHIGGKRYFRYFTDWPIQSIGGYLVVGTAGGEQAVYRASSFWAQTVDWIKDIVSVADPIQHSPRATGLTMASGSGCRNARHWNEAPRAS
jgi:hypothetical protein